MLIWSVILLGLLGNLHCVGMCGPIALAIPVKGPGSAERLRSGMVYNSGRILTYAILGAVMGAFGQGLNLFGAQQALSVGLGVLLLLVVLVPVVGAKIHRLQQPLFPWVSAVKNRFKKHFKQRNYRSIFTIGLLNGLLPCGMVFTALTLAVISGDWVLGAGYMAVFGLGTLPVMLLLPLAGGWMGSRTRGWFRKLMPAFALVFGLLLILRGANLGIPYISPQIITQQPQQEVICH